MANVSSLTNFGAGFLTLLPPLGGDPVQVGVLQDISLDSSQGIKELYGANRYAVDLGGTEAKLSGKIKTGQINFNLIAAIMAGGTINSGAPVGVNGETVVIDQTLYTYTAATVTGFVDLGVYDATSNKFLDKISSGTPAAGQYEVSSGVYTFAAADKAHAMKAYYSYTVNTGSTLTVSNSPMGDDTVFSLVMYNKRRTGRFGYKLYNVLLTKYSLGFKNNDFTISDIDYSAFAGLDGSVIDFYQATVA